mgnify:CR=1 FL=1
MAGYKVEICGVNTSKLPLLTNEEKTDLFRRIQNGDTDAREIYIKGNLRLVLSVIQRFSGSSENIDDLFQIGCIGLIKAIDNFDLSQNVKFSTYAVPMIMGEIRRYLRDNQVIRVSRHLKDLSYQLFRLKEAYMHEHHQEPSVEYLAKQCNVKEKDVIDALDSCQSVLSIFEPIYSSEGDELYLLDQIRDEHDDISKERDLIALEKSMKILNERENEIIHKRYYDDMTQMEIAKEMGISQAQVSRLEKNAIQALKKEMEK